MANDFEYGSIDQEPMTSFKLDRPAESKREPSETIPAPGNKPIESAERKPESAPARTPRKEKSTRSQFEGALQPLQVKLPEDLIQSLRLIAISQGKNLSELTLEFLTSTELVQKAWVSHRRAG